MLCSPIRPYKPVNTLTYVRSAYFIRRRQRPQRGYAHGQASLLLPVHGPSPRQILPDLPVSIAPATTANPPAAREAPTTLALGTPADGQPLASAHPHRHPATSTALPLPKPLPFLEPRQQLVGRNARRSCRPALPYLPPSERRPLCQ